MAGLVPCACCAQAQEPTRVEPVTVPIAELPAAPAPPAGTAGLAHNRLDRAHDWLYLRLQHFIGGVDARFSDASQAPEVIAASPLRLGLSGEWVRGPNATSGALRPDFEASLKLPNLERRLRLFISSSDLTESTGNAALDRNPFRAGLRLESRLHLNFDLGVRLQVKPKAYAAIRWSPEFRAGTIHFYPFAKPYLESGLGLGASGGIAIEHWHDGWFQRLASFANWTRRASATEWSQSLLVGHAHAVITEGRYDRVSSGRDLACGTALHALASGARLAGADTYELGLMHKRPLRGSWLYGYVEPFLRWERANDWHADPGLRAGFDVLLWGPASAPPDFASLCR